MITILEVKKQISDLEAEGEEYRQAKLLLQKNHPKEEIKRQVFSLDKKRKRVADRVANARHIMNIIETIDADVMRTDRNNLLIKINAIQEREPINEKTGEKYTTEERKNPVTAKAIKDHYSLYKYDKLMKQYRALTIILRP